MVQFYFMSFFATIENLLIQCEILKNKVIFCDIFSMEKENH